MRQRQRLRSNFWLPWPLVWLFCVGGTQRRAAAVPGCCWVAACFWCCQQEERAGATPEQVAAAPGLPSFGQVLFVRLLEWVACVFCGFWLWRRGPQEQVACTWLPRRSPGSLCGALSAAWGLGSSQAAAATLATHIKVLAEPEGRSAGGHAGAAARPAQNSSTCLAAGSASPSRGLAVRWRCAGGRMQ